MLGVYMALCLSIVDSENISVVSVLLNSVSGLIKQLFTSYPQFFIILPNRLIFKGTIGAENMFSKSVHVFFFSSSFIGWRKCCHSISIPQDQLSTKPRFVPLSTDLRTFLLNNPPART